MRHAAIPILFGAAFLCGCDPSSTRQPTTRATSNTPTSRPATEPAEYKLFLAQTGLDIPADVEVVNYASGWDERYLVLRMPRSALQAFVAPLPVQPKFSKPEMEGMAGEAFRPTWWRPSDIKPAQYFEGQMKWKTGAIGMVRVLVEDAEPARVLVWVMKA